MATYQSLRVLREAAQPPTISHLPTRPPRIVIKHPGYDEHDTLLELNALDADGNGDGDRPPTYGLQHGFVLDVCGILAGNRFDGHLCANKSSLSESSDSIRDMPKSALLLAGTYYFHVPRVEASSDTADFTLPNAIVPNFRQWVFPKEETNELPEHWRKAEIATSRTEGECLVTGHKLSVERSHIIPQGERRWRDGNGMSHWRIASQDGVDIVDGPENRLFLRSDVHAAWDRGHLSFVPKYDKTTSSWCWVSHAHVHDPPELFTEYHNRRLRPMARIPVEFLFARFAYDIFRMLRTFINSPVGRYLRTNDNMVRLFEGEDKTNFVVGQGATRSSSPSKSPSKRAMDEQGGSPTKRMSNAVSYRGGVASDMEEQRSDSGIGSPESQGSRKRKCLEESVDQWHGDVAACPSRQDGLGKDTGEQLDDCDHWGIPIEDLLDNPPRGRKRLRVGQVDLTAVSVR